MHLHQKALTNNPGGMCCERHAQNTHTQHSCHSPHTARDKPRRPVWDSADRRLNPCGCVSMAKGNIDGVQSKQGVGGSGASGASGGGLSQAWVSLSTPALSPVLNVPGRLMHNIHHLCGMWCVSVTYS